MAEIPMTPDGAFLIGFDRDAGPSAQLVTTGSDGRQLHQTLTIAPRAWRIERLDRLPKYPVPDPEFQRLRPPELEQICAARAQETDATGWRQTLQWPVKGRISGLFGAQRIYRGEPGSYHSGTDIAATTGTVVRAPADGVVILAADQPFTLEGHLLMLDHGRGLNSAFLHLSRIDVRPGEHVHQWPADRCGRRHRPRHRPPSPLEPAMARPQARPAAGDGADGLRAAAAIECV